MCNALVIDNSNISLLPDFSAEVKKQRAQFTKVKKHLCSLELHYAMLYPVHLRAVNKGEVHFFEKLLLDSTLK